MQNKINNRIQSLSEEAKQLVIEREQLGNRLSNLELRLAQITAIIAELQELNNSKEPRNEINNTK